MKKEMCFCFKLTMVDSVNHIKWQECQSLIYVYNPNKNIIKKDQDKTITTKTEQTKAKEKTNWNPSHQRMKFRSKWLTSDVSLLRSVGWPYTYVFVVSISCVSESDFTTNHVYHVSLSFNQVLFSGTWEQNKGNSSITVCKS